MCGVKFSGFLKLQLNSVKIKGVHDIPLPTPLSEDFKFGDKAKPLGAQGDPRCTYEYPLRTKASPHGTRCNPQCTGAGSQGEKVFAQSTCSASQGAQLIPQGEHNGLQGEHGFPRSTCVGYKGTLGHPPATGHKKTGSKNCPRSPLKTYGNDGDGFGADRSVFLSFLISSSKLSFFPSNPGYPTAN